MRVSLHRVTGIGLVCLLAACGGEKSAGDAATNDNGNQATDGGMQPDGGVADGSVGPGPEPDPWSPPGTEDDGAFAWGVQSGDVGPNDAWLSVRSLEPSLSLTVVRGVAAGWEEVHTESNLVPVDGVVQLRLTGLAPDNTYSFAFYATDGQRRSRPGRFRTALAVGQSRVIRFGATHGLGGNWPWPGLSVAAAERLDFFLLLGDTIYADWGANVGVVEKWKEALSTEGMLDLTASTSLIATWDDHEVGDNWSYTTPGMDALVAEGLAAYRQAIPQVVGPGGTGVWRTLSWGQAMDVFSMDCRGERRNGNYISPEQMTWLKEGLASSTAAFKVILNSVPITDFTGTTIGAIAAADRWQGFTAQRTEILDHIANQQIPGVLWITGDFHIGGVIFVDAPGGVAQDVPEIFAGPSGTSINAAAQFINPSARIPIIIKQFNYTLFEANPANGRVDITFIGDTGAIIDQTSVNVF